MKLTESLIRHKVLKDNIEQLKLRLTQAAKTQEVDTPTKRPQELLALLEVELQNLQASIIQGNRANPRAIQPDGTTHLEVVTQCDYPDLWQRIFEDLVTSTPPAQDRYTYAGKACPDDRDSETMWRGGTAIHCFVRTGRYHLEGGLRHVPAIAGSAHSQAPPIPQAGETGNRSQHI